MTLLLEDEADFVIAGTGAGGATAARVLADAGRSVVMLEEGPNLAMRERPRELLPAMRDVFRDLGTTVAQGPAPMPILQGRVVGGSTTINSGIIWRLPEAIRTRWTAEFGLRDLAGGPELDAIFAQIEDDLEVEPTGDAVLGGNSERLRDGAAKLGFGGHPTRRNARRCQGSNRCLQGCPNAAKQSLDVSYIPRALAKGARLHALARAERVFREGGRAAGIEGSILDATTRRPKGRFRIRAKRGVILSAGVIHTPVLLRRSGVRGLAGDRFQAHPGTAVLARFPQPVRMAFGATQGWQIPFFDQGFKIESLSMPPEMLATRLPGAGPEWQARLAELDHYAQCAVMCRMEAMGRVRPGFGGGASIRYTPTARDLEVIRKGIVLAARMYFAAGATEVLPGIAGRPEVLRSPDDLKHLEAPLSAKDLHLLATHLFGTACAGDDPKRSVVAPSLETHALKSLYAMDASIFPTNIGVNPQHSIMGLVWRAAARLA